MNTHIKVVGWLWIANGVLSICMATSGLALINTPGTIPDPQDALLVSVGGLCFFLPGIIAYVLAGYGLLNFKNWARILAIILAILNLILFPIGTVLGIYTLIIMFNEETKTIFRGEDTPAEVEEVNQVSS